MGVQPKIELEDWSLTISGLVDSPKMSSWNDFMSLPQVEDVSDFHFGISWSRPNNRWWGVRLMDIANYCGILSSAKFAYIKAYDVYNTNLAIIEAMKPDVLLVHQ